MQVVMFLIWVFSFGYGFWIHIRFAHPSSLPYHHDRPIIRLLKNVSIFIGQIAMPRLLYRSCEFTDQIKSNVTTSEIMSLCLNEAPKVEANTNFFFMHSKKNAHRHRRKWWTLNCKKESLIGRFQAMCLLEPASITYIWSLIWQ